MSFAVRSYRADNKLAPATVPVSSSSNGRSAVINLDTTSMERILTFAVRPDGAFHQWREDPPRELSIALVADERFGRVTGWIEAS